MVSTAEFIVQKVAPYRHGESAFPISRTLCLTEQLLVERDPISYRPISAQPLHYVRWPMLNVIPKQLFSNFIYSICLCHVFQF